MIIPTIDTELTVLAELRDRFSNEGIHVIVSDRDFVAACRDKRKTPELCSSLGIKTLKIYDKSMIEFPCFTKPYNGSSSVGALALNSAHDLTEDLLADSDRMFMELAPSHWKEITVDLYFDTQNRLRCAVPRVRIETRSGEVSKGFTRRDWLYDEVVSKFSKIQGATGCLTLQVFADEENQNISVIEINPRFGGGFPLSYAARADYPGWLIDEYFLGKDVPYFESWINNILMLRYDANIIVEQYNV